jgi:hypothetical protein
MTGKHVSMTTNKHALAPTIPAPSLGNGPLNTSHKNRGIVVNGVFCVVCAKAIQLGPTGQASQFRVENGRSESVVSTAICSCK